jgi:serine/threonine protein kinase
MAYLDNNQFFNKKIMPILAPPTIAPPRPLTLSGDNAIANINQTIAEIRETLLEGLDNATLSPLGEGGFGTTQLAQFPNGARCVVKTIAKHAPTEATAIFKTEAEALKGLDHPQIPKLLGTGAAPDGLPYILQQYIPGQNLEQIFKASGNWGLDEVKEMVRAIASILDYLHKKGLAHRDVKPQNILRNESGYYLVDFGSSKVVDDRTGTVIGSFAYAAPEQVMGKACARSDIYSLGMTAVHLLTGLNERELVDPATDEWLWVGIYEERFNDREFLDLLKSMLERGTSKRPSAAEIIEKLQELESIESDRWIKPHEALPDENEMLICQSGSRTDSGTYHGVYSCGQWYRITNGILGLKKPIFSPYQWRYYIAKSKDSWEWDEVDQKCWEKLENLEPKKSDAKRKSAIAPIKEKNKLFDIDHRTKATIIGGLEMGQALFVPELVREQTVFSEQILGKEPSSLFLSGATLISVGIAFLGSLMVLFAIMGKYDSDF